MGHCWRPWHDQHPRFFCSSGLVWSPVAPSPSLGQNMLGFSICVRRGNGRTECKEVAGHLQAWVQSPATDTHLIPDSEKRENAGTIHLLTAAQGSKWQTADPVSHFRLSLLPKLRLFWVSGRANSLQLRVSAMTEANWRSSKHSKIGLL